MTASSATHNVEKHPSAKEERKQSKLEKADILEMTVKHLQNIQKSKVNDPTVGVEAQQRYSTGYIQCMHEVHNMLLTCDWMDKTLGSRLLNHLLKSLPRTTDARSASRHGASPVIPDPPVSGDHLSRRQICQAPVQEEKPLLPTSHLGMLHMWRPW